MTNEEKQILLNDLKYRLYTKTQCRCIWADAAKNGSAGVVNELDTYLLDELEMIGNPDYEYMFSDIKPYLRSMESMTKEERKEFSKLLDKRYCEEDWEGHISTSYCIEIDSVYNDDEGGIKWPSTFRMDAINWLIEHHFDFLGLIKLGLALEAPKGMYN